MARRFRRRPRKTNRTVQIVQIAGLALVLVIVLLFRDEIANGAGALFAGDQSADVRLPEEQQPPQQPTSTAPPARSTP